MICYKAIFHTPKKMNRQGYKAIENAIVKHISLPHARSLAKKFTRELLIKFRDTGYKLIVTDGFGLCVLNYNDVIERIDRRQPNPDLPLFPSELPEIPSTVQGLIAVVTEACKYVKLLVFNSDFDGDTLGYFNT